MILITGASKGIGRFLFEEFKHNGYEVSGTYNSTDCSGLYLNKVNVADYENVKDWIASINNLSDITLINCAAISDSCFIHKSEPENWVNIVNTNIIGCYNTIRNVIPIMRKQQYGRIINFSSVISKLPTPGVSAYATSKAALSGLIKTIAIENGSLGITANSISLGYAEIGMGINDVTPHYREKIIEKIPTGRFCTPNEIYDTVLFLMKNNYINGATIDMNGGII